MKRGERSWLVLNQSQSPQFQAMLERLTKRHGPCEILTGSPFPVKDPAVTLVRGPAYNRASLPRRALSWLRFLISATWRVLAGRRPVLILVTTNPPFLLHLAWLASKLRGVPYILLIWDIYPDHAIQQGWLKIDGLIARLWRACNRWSLNGAAAVVTLGHAMAGVLAAQAPGATIVVIPNWADTDAIRPLPKNENPFAIEHDQVGRVTILYSGNIGKTHGVSLLVDAASRLSDLNDLHFLVIGDGLGLARVREAATLAGLENLTLLPLQPWSTVPLSLATGDIAVVLQEGDSAHLSVPSKTYSLMAAGCAVVASTVPGSDLARLVEDSHMGGVVTANDAEALASAIRDLHDHPQALEAARASARDAAERVASVGAAAAMFSSIFQKVLP